MILALLLAAAMPDLAVPVLAVPPAVFADAEVAQAAPVLAWPKGTALRVAEDGDELVARFDRPLRDEAIAAFRDRAGDALDDLRWNDDSLVLRAAPGYTMRWRVAGTRVAVDFVPGAAPADAAAAAADDDGGALDVALARVEADAAAGYPGQARRRAEALARAHPGDMRVVRSLADARSGDGDLPRAARGYRDLDADDAPARRTMAMAPGTASIGVTARDGGDLSQIEGAARADVAVDEAVSVGGGVRAVRSRIGTPAGTRTAGRWFVDAGVGLALEGAARAQLVLSSAIDDGVTGGGVRASLGSAEAQLRAIVLIHMPDVSTGAQALGAGWLSRLGIGGSYRLSPDWSVQAEAGRNRYGLSDDGGATDTTTLSGGIDWLARRGQPSVTLGYRLEAEYVGRRRRGADGAPAIPLATRENHIVQGVASGTVGGVQVTGQLGYTVDRFGGDGPVAGLGLAAPIGDGWRIDGGGGVSSIARAGFSGTQLYGRAQITRGLGRGK